MKQRGFTLIELMVTVVIVAIIAAIALPSYQEYVRRQRLAVAQQEMQIIAGELERFKGKNFSYKGFNGNTFYTNFDTNTGTLQIPIDKTNKTYTITLVDADSKLPLTDGSSNGLNWAMMAIRNTPVDQNNYDLLLRSDGKRCKTKDSGKVNDGNYADCGPNPETW